MRRAIWHVALPALAPAAIIGLYFTPVSLLGCTNRGLLALTVVLVSAAGAFVAVGLALRARRSEAAPWWIATTLILTLPLALILGPLG